MRSNELSMWHPSVEHRLVCQTKRLHAATIFLGISRGRAPKEARIRHDFPSGSGTHAPRRLAFFYSFGCIKISAGLLRMHLGFRTLYMICGRSGGLPVNHRSESHKQGNPTTIPFEVVESYYLIACHFSSRSFPQARLSTIS